MASDLDTWWPANYPTYSIRDLHSLPIFHRFLQLHYPYERTNPTSLESFLTSDSLDEFLTSDQDNEQKFTHNKREGIYTYSKKYKEKDCAVQVTSSIQGHMEWGTVQRVFDTWEVRETWKLTPPHREYEQITIEKDGKKGYKCGTKAKGEATERWLEETFESGEEATYRKTWETETGRGGETRNTKGGYSWGETWFNEGESSSEKKVWHEKDGKKWGEHSGKQGTETWNYRWEEEKDSKLEEKLTEKEGKMTGFRYNTKGAEWYRQEWEGAKAFPEALTVAPLSSTQFSRLTELYLQTEASVQASAHTLHLFLPSIPSNSSKIQSLDDRFLHIQSSDRSTFDLLLTRIDELHRLATDQESLKLAMWTEARRGSADFRSTCMSSNMSGVV